MSIAEQQIYDVMMEDRAKNIRSSENARMLQIFKMEHANP